MRKTGIKYLLGIVAGAFALLCGSTSFAGNTILPYPNQVEWPDRETLVGLLRRGFQV